RYAAPRYSITEARGPDLWTVLQGFPELGGTRRTVPIDLWRHHLTRYRYTIGRTADSDRVDVSYTIESLNVPIGYLTDAIGATVDSKPPKRLDDLALTAATDASCDVRVVQLDTRNSRVMTIGIHLWPPVEPGSIRSVSLGYRWPEMWD